jgi:hypothetical protein
MQHTSALKQVLQYLAGTRTLGITYSGNSGQRETNLFQGYADAVFANVDGCKSTSGYIFKSGGGAITWCSKKQTTIVLLLTEAEYIALSEASREVCWLRNLYAELGESQNEPSVIMGDNEGAIAMA